MLPMSAKASIFFLLVVIFGDACAEEMLPGKILYTKFYFPEEFNSNQVLDGLCLQDGDRIAPILADAAISLAGKAVGSLVDLVASKAKAEAVSLESISSMEGFYGPKNIAADGGCFLIHNGRPSDASGATFKAIFQLYASEDKSAFQFKVLKWQFNDFFVPKSGNWFQDKTHKDFVIRIEFLSPGTDSVGTRSVFIERAFSDVTKDDIANAYVIGERTPWFRAPAVPVKLQEGNRTLPLNIRTSVIETSRPGQIGTWLAEIATSKKGDIVSFAENALRNKLDDDSAATAASKGAESASTAFDAYKKEWDGIFESSKNIPVLVDNPTKDQKAKFDADTISWKATIKAQLVMLSSKRTLAQSAYSVASLPWPGDLPVLDGK